MQYIIIIDSGDTTLGVLHNGMGHSLVFDSFDEAIQHNEIELLGSGAVVPYSVQLMEILSNLYEEIESNREALGAVLNIYKAPSKSTLLLKSLLNK